MKAVVLDASPRRNGLVSAMASRIAGSLIDGGWTVETVDVTGCRVAPCRGCMTCRSTGQCVLQPDDAQRVLALLRDADAVIVGAPCYWGNMPGTLKLLLDRIVYGLMTTDARGIPHGLLRGRRYAIVTASTTPWPWNLLFRQTSGTVRALREVFGTAGFYLAGAIQVGGSRRLSGRLTPRLLRSCDRLAHRLNRATAR